ncbi:MAG: TIM barrel protein [Sporomusaceae bacterium]|nr:TIM barrel protein [Sporomusaceae bacterium]
MLELINFANYDRNRAMINNNPAELEKLLAELGVDGIEALFCDPWDPALLPAALIHGVHLNFWPTWLDFWRGDQQALARQFGSRDNIFAYFGGREPADMLAAYRRDFGQASAAGAAYAVFHVSHNEPDEIYTWRFRADSLAVVDATIEVVNSLAKDIPDNLTLLFENLWWPGMTLLEPRLVDRLLSRIDHANAGIMLDTGHLMNTNADLVSEHEGIAYILRVLDNLGSLRQAVRGIHLNRSLSGEYVKASRCRTAPAVSLAETMAHVLRIDQHQPFADPAARRIIEAVEPRYLVHEFIVDGRDALLRQTRQQRQAIACRQPGRNVAAALPRDARYIRVE